MHTAAQTRLDGVIAAASLAPKESALSAALIKASSDIVSKLQATDLGTFDAIYVQTQIDVHRQVLDAIDQQLLPNAKSAVVRTEIATTRAAVVDHLNPARALATALELSVDAGTEADAGL